jgi:molecular chaperone HscB
MTSDSADLAPGIRVRIDANDFELFEIPPRFVQDRADLDARWKALQMQVHPDRFASQGTVAQRLAMQWAVRVNEAYQRLKTPLARAAYLCELHGHAIEAETNTAMPAAFLMQQMAWREALDEARSKISVEALDDEVATCQRALQNELAALIDERHDWPAAATQVRALMFATRFAQDVERRLDALSECAAERIRSAT